MPEIAHAPYVVLDTHVVYWLQVEPERLSPKARHAISFAQRHAGLAISVFTLYELAQMVRRRRIIASGPIADSVRKLTADIPVLPITLEIADMAVRFPDTFPGDPGDRLIASTALAENVPLITADERIRKSGVVRAVW